MPLIDHFGILAPFYDRAIRLRNEEKLIEMVNPPANGVLLDAGGGTGRVAVAFDGSVDRVIVSDLSMGMLKQAQKKGCQRLTCAHTEYLPFPSDSFERVIMVDALHHVCDQRDSAGELWRVLKPGGRLVIIEPDVSTFVVKLVAVAEKLALMRSHFLSPEKIAGLFSFQTAGVQIQRDGFNAWIIVDKGIQAA